MAIQPQIIRLAAAQAAPVWLNQSATIKKACGLIEEAADHGAQMIGFPESFVPCFPDWYNWFMPRSPQAKTFHTELVKHAVEIPGPAVDALSAAARRAKMYVVMGVTERAPGTLGTLYNSQLFFGPDGALLGVHRKLVPTFTERLVHFAGDGSCLRAYPTAFGSISGLICGENGNGLARYALYTQEERFHFASWPAFIEGEHQFNSIDIRTKNMALEGHLFVINACGVLTEACLDAMGLTPEQRTAIPRRGGHSSIIGPDGEYIVGPADNTEQILYADANTERIIGGKLKHDTIGHYNRLDVFTLQIKAVPRQGLSIVGRAGAPAGSDNHNLSEASMWKRQDTEESP